MRSNQCFSFSSLDDAKPKTANRTGNWLYLIVFAVEYTYAVFNVFAGPLFSNIIAGQFLDCVIWGVPPVIFWLIQPYLLTFINNGNNPYRRRLFLLVFLVLCKLLSYAMLCFSEKWKWNSMSLTFNVDFGYVLLDLSCKIVYLIFSQDERNSEEQTSSSLNSLKFSFTSHVTCYFITLYFVFLFPGEHLKVLQSCCLLGVLVNIPIPFFYYLWNKQHIKEEHIHQNDGQLRRTNYTNLQEVEQEDCTTDKISFWRLCSIFLMQSSLAINLSYSTLWIMDGLMSKSVSEDQSFMTSVMHGAAFYCMSTLLYLGSGYVMQKIKIKALTYVFNILYGLLLIQCYFKFSVGSICLVILLTGVQLNIANSADRNQTLESLPNLIILAEFVVFCLVPVFFEFGLHSQSVNLYMLVSGGCCLFSIIFQFI